jgi:hypothetical protein
VEKLKVNFTKKSSDIVPFKLYLQSVNISLIRYNISLILSETYFGGTIGLPVFISTKTSIE